MSNFDLTNQFLIAMPTLGDPNFHHTVTWICAHNDEGAMGIVINRPADMALGEVLEQMDIESNAPEVIGQGVFEGGPVQPDRGFIIHRPGANWTSTMEVSDEMAVSTSRDILEAIAQGHGPDKTLVALGYAGWGAGQLEREMQDNAWLSGPADAAIVFETAVESRWRDAAALIGVDLASISSDVGHA